MARNFGVDSLITTIEGKTGSATGWATAMMNFAKAFKSDATGTKARMQGKKLNSSVLTLTTSYTSMTLNDNIPNYEFLFVKYDYDMWSTTRKIDGSIILITDTFLATPAVSTIERVYGLSSTNYLDIELLKDATDLSIQLRYVKGTETTNFPTTAVRVKEIFGY